MKIIFFISALCLSFSVAKAQSIVGKWQLVKQTSCMDDEIVMDDSGVEDLVEDMKGRSSVTPQIISLKDNARGEESTRVLSKKKTYNEKSFMYKFDGNNLYILDKKSRTIIEAFTVEKFSTDSLIISNSARACETKVFIKISR